MVESRVPVIAVVLVALVIGATHASGEDDEFAPATEQPGEVVEVSGQVPYEGEPVQYKVSADDARVMPGSGNDTLKSLQSLPGVARVPFGIGGLVLRGSSPRDSNVYLDGIEVPLVYHFGGLASVYPSAMLESLELIPGSFGPEYGRAQGGIVVLQSRPGRAGDDGRWRVGSGLSVLDASVRAEGPGLGGGWSLGVRRSYIDAILALVLPEDAGFDLTLAPRYYDAQVRYDRDISPRQRISVMLFGADDRLRFLRNDNTINYQSSFARLGARWRHRSGPITLSVTPWLGVNRVILDRADEGTTRTSLPIGTRGSAHYDLGLAGYVSAGVDLQGGRFSFDLNNRAPLPDDSDAPPVQRTGADWHGDAAVWIAGFYRVERGRFGVKPGLRVERYGLTGEWVIDPRVVVSHALPAGVTLRESFGVFHQPPLPTDVDPAFGNQRLRSSRAVQATVGVDVNVGAASLAVTGYHDELYGLPVDAVSSATVASEGSSAYSGGFISIGQELATEQFGSYTFQENRGHGRNTGLEILLKHSSPRWFAWLAYTYSRATRSDDPRRFISYRPYILDQPHLMTLALSTRLGAAWRLGARARYASGNPYTPVADTYFDAEASEVRPIDGPLLSARLPAFFQLDVRVDRTWRRPWGTIELFVDVQNATNRLNPEGIRYNDDFSDTSFTRGLPIIPSLGLSYTY